MEILEYSGQHKEDCVSVLRSNIGSYIAEWELQEYVEFLDGEATVEPYFIVVDKGDVVACGGFAATPEKVVLTWGLVRNDLHGQGVGKLLLHHRLRCIQERFGALPIHIETSQKTQGFFQKYGFEPVEIVKDGISQGLDKVYMVYRSGGQS